ncbi:hypothetical protein SE17_17155 [Kouleothrix aurantiaca]|jgi:hypothetical protein|uniref:Uncharacterized protein n=1 Tax=Kouleothrix aurantiaca TaxID=186479 RepID=A0A0N8PSA2_9CHLR|nr:hypothetical protein SE17_17155 [Kouleothrix aurantiaca]
MPVQCTRRPSPFALLFMLALLALLPTHGRPVVAAYDPPGDDLGPTTGLGSSSDEGDEAP